MNESRVIPTCRGEKVLIQSYSVGEALEGHLLGRDHHSRMHWEVLVLSAFVSKTAISTRFAVCLACSLAF